MTEKLSAFLDGDIDAAQSDPVFESLRRTPELRERWDTYCLIGDALRGDSDRGVSDLLARVMAGVEAEPTILAPAAARINRSRPSFGRSFMPIAASVMGVAAVGIVAFTMFPKGGDTVVAPGVLASDEAARVVVASTLAPVQAPVATDDPNREYMFAHQAMSGGGPIPGVVHYVRTVSDVRGELR